MRVPLIEDNPLRILGVYANSTLREIEQNKAQLRAFARVGQEVQLPLWLNGLSLLTPLPTITEDLLTQAQSQLSLQADHDRYGFFWFERETLDDLNEEEAIAQLNNNQVEEACRLWKQRSSYAAQKNLLLIAVLTDDWNEIAIRIDPCFNHNMSAFRMFMAEVLKTSPKANSPQSHELPELFEGNLLREEMKRMLINWHKQALEDAIDHLKRTNTSNSLMLMNEIQWTYSEKSHLEVLKNLLGNNSFTYTYYANELSKTILNAIKVYLDHNDSLISYKWAVDMAKELCENLSESEPDLIKLKSLESIIEYRIHRESHLGDSDDTSTSLSSAIMWFLGVFIFLGLIRTCENKSHKENYYPLKPSKYERYHIPYTPSNTNKYELVITTPSKKSSIPEEKPGYVWINGRYIHEDSLKNYIIEITNKRLNKRLKYMDNAPKKTPISHDKDTHDSPMDSVSEYQDLLMPMEQMEPKTDSLVEQMERDSISEQLDTLNNDE